METVLALTIVNQIEKSPPTDPQPILDRHRGSIVSKIGFSIYYVDEIDNRNRFVAITAGKRK